MHGPSAASSRSRDPILALLALLVLVPALPPGAGVYDSRFNTHHGIQPVIRWSDGRGCPCRCDCTLTAPRVIGPLDVVASIYNVLDARYTHPGSEAHV